MKSSGIYLIAVLLSVFATACIDDEPPSETDLSGTSYTGVIPCADCEGIAYKLSLKKDHRFETTSVYIGKSNRAYSERGMWSMKGDSLVILNMAEENPRQFKIKNNQLIMLDQQGKESAGSLSKMYVLSESDSAKTDHRWETRRSRGIDFRAAGNEPSWSLDIDFDQAMIFKTLNGDSVYTKVPPMTKDTASKARVWTKATPSGLLRVEIYPIGCVDDMSGEVFSYFVNINYSEQRYRGCGNFINNVYKLNDFWSLHRVGASEVKTAATLPALQFDVAHNKVYGTTGCNQLQGTIDLKESALSFSRLITTKMACRGDLEARFLEALRKVDTYTISNARLLLMNPGRDTLLVFRRAE